MDQRTGLRSRRAQQVAGLLGLAAITLGLGIWVTLGRASTNQFKTPASAAASGLPAASSSAAAAQATALTAPAFLERCEASVKRRDASRSIANCTPFLAEESLAAQAHAALAVAYMLQDPPNPKESAAHAAVAAEAGNLTGSTLLVMHALRGDAGVTMPMESIWATLQRASALPPLRALHQQVGTAMRCRVAAQFRLRDMPVFCLLRTEITAWAKQNGMEPLKADDAWSDRYRVAGSFPGVRALEVVYDRDPATGLYTPASVIYRLDADTDTDPALQDITTALDAKYRRTGRTATAWLAADGVAISLRRSGMAMALHYELPQRVETARRNALEEAQRLGKARVEKVKALL